jgi:hypothetical protein
MLREAVISPLNLDPLLWLPICFVELRARSFPLLAIKTSMSAIGAIRTPVFKDVSRFIAFDRGSIPILWLMRPTRACELDVLQFHQVYFHIHPPPHNICASIPL